MGIDPGTVVMGYGIISIIGNTPAVIEMDVLKLSSSADHYQRLQVIHEKICSLITTFKPCSFAIEAPFYGKNVQSMLKLGRAQGVAIAAAMQNGLPVCEYSPKRIKQSITGNGNAGKEQVMKMLQKLLSFDTDPKYLDASDALAVAMCHYFQQNNPATSTEKVAVKSWKAFITGNPSRIAGGL